MQISKTQFKDFSRCARSSALYDLYVNKLNNRTENDDEAKELLHIMYDDVSGSDNLASHMSKIKQDSYTEVEELAAQFIEQQFGFSIIHSTKTSEQKVFSYQANQRTSYYAYLDGYLDTTKDVHIFEVKATTAKKYITLTNNAKKLFVEKNGIWRIDQSAQALQTGKIEYRKLLNRYSDVGQYVYDLSFQRAVIERSNNFQKEKRYHYYLVVLNSNFMFDGNKEHLLLPDENGEHLFIIIDMSVPTKDMLSTIYKDMEQTTTAILRNDIARVPVGKFCELKGETACMFTEVCWNEYKKEGSILDYTYATRGFKTETGEIVDFYELINANKYKIDSIPEEWLTRKINQIQRKSYEEKALYVDKEKLKKGLEVLTYPIYHLDFESYPSPIPRFFGESPYVQSVFMYSLHIQKDRNTCDYDNDHYTFLSRDLSDHRLDLVKSMIKHIDLSNGGTVLTYNKTFEIGRIEELARLFPEHKKELLQIRDHIFDLMDLVNTNTKHYQELGFDEARSRLPNIYHYNQRGSYSIKKVLPLFSDLRYANLEIQDGNDALEQYASYDLYEDEDKAKIQDNLIKYCKLDTWAMYLVLRGLYLLLNE